MKESLKNWLSINNIHYILHHHPAVFTVVTSQLKLGKTWASS
ncbi:MAG: hypothetical protein ACTSWH_07560 [Promethearchaeota archaeon]